MLTIHTHAYNIIYYNYRHRLDGRKSIFSFCFFNRRRHAAPSENFFFQKSRNYTRTYATPFVLYTRIYIYICMRVIYVSIRARHPAPFGLYVKAKLQRSVKREINRRDSTIRFSFATSSDAIFWFSNHIGARIHDTFEEFRSLQAKVNAPTDNSQTLPRVYTRNHFVAYVSCAFSVLRINFGVVNDPVLIWCFWK